MFMTSWLSVMAYNLSEGLHKGKYKNWKSDFEYMTVNDGSLIFKCIDC